jgi:hypothetical protein
MAISFTSIGRLGRLGNQMFQFASAVGISQRAGTKAIFPLEACLELNNTGPINPETGQNTLVKCDILDGFDIQGGHFIPVREFPEIHSRYMERNFGYCPETSDLQDGTDLYGYFQTEKYFSESSEYLRNSFRFKKEVKEKAIRYWEKNIERVNVFTYCSIHVRRGDYLMYPNHHPTCSAEYYNSAIERMDRLGRTIYVVFSDDTEWCKTQFAGDNFIVVETGDQFQDMYLMSHCHHNIIANSSFSWWGAWLNKNPFKKVIAPSRWFGPEIPKDVSDIYCPSWEVI